MGSTKEGGIKVVATAMTPSILTTTRRSWRIRTNSPITPSKTPPVIRTFCPLTKCNSAGYT